MKFKWPLMLAALAVSAWLALWGDKTPVDGGVVVQPVASLAASREAVAPQDQQHLQAHSQVTAQVKAGLDQAAMQNWLKSPLNPFAPLDAEATPSESASAPVVASNNDTQTPFVLLGRGRVDSGQEAVFVQVDDEVRSLKVGSSVAQWRVVSIGPDTLLMRQVKTHETLRLPLGTPNGVFDQ